MSESGRQLSSAATPGTAVEQDLARAETDYLRLRGAFLAIARGEPGNELALAMVGADLDRAHARLQALAGHSRLPLASEASSVVRREALRLVEGSR